MVAELPKVTSACAALPVRYFVKCIRALLQQVALGLSYIGKGLHASYLSRLAITKLWTCSASLAPEIVHLASLHKIKFNRAALDDLLYLFLSGRLQSCLQVKTEEDLGVILSDPSTHEPSLQSRHHHAAQKPHTFSYQRLWTPPPYRASPVNPTPPCAFTGVPLRASPEDRTRPLLHPVAVFPLLS